MKLARLLAVAAFSTMCAVSANAATVNITSVTGLWTDVDPDNVVGLNPIGLNSSSVSWGTSTGQGQSGYDFSGLAPQLDISSPFTVGTFTHRNFPIAGSPSPPSITGATLEVTVQGNVDGVANPFTLGSTFVFSHDETSNSSSNCPGQAVPCDDIVTLVSSSFTGDSLVLDGVEYVFNLEGFVVDDMLFTSFATTEGQANTADLLGAFVTREQTVVPLPAAGFLLLSALGALGFFRRFGRMSS